MYTLLPTHVFTTKRMKIVHSANSFPQGGRTVLTPQRVRERAKHKFVTTTILEDELAQTHTRTHKHTRARTIHTHTHTHTHMRTHTHTHTHRSPRSTTFHAGHGCRSGQVAGKRYLTARNASARSEVGGSRGRCRAAPHGNLGNRAGALHASGDCVASVSRRR